MFKKEWRIKLLLVSTLIFSNIACEQNDNPAKPGVDVPQAAFNKRPHHFVVGSGGVFEFSVAADKLSEISGYECKLDGGSFASCSSPKVITGLADGPHVLQVRSINSSGAVSAASTFAWIIEHQFTTPSYSGTTNEKWLYDVYIDDSNNIFLGTKAGPRISTNGGDSFTTVTNGLDLVNYRAFRVSKTNTNKLLVATNGGLGISTNNGTNFTLKTTSDGLGSNTINDLAIDSSGRIFLATTAGLSVSTDDGGTFTNITAGLPNTFLTGLFWDSEAGKLWISTDGGLAATTNAGATFTTKTTSQGIISNNLSSVVAKGSKVAVASFSGISVSTDGGSTWSSRTVASGHLRTNLLDKISIDSLGTLYTNTYGFGLAFSPDWGTTWLYRTTSHGLATNSLLRAVAVKNQVWALSSSDAFSKSTLSNSFSQTVVDTVPPTIATRDVTSVNLKGLTQAISWSAASDNMSMSLNYRVLYSSTAANTIADAFASGTLASEVLSSTATTLRLPANGNKTVHVVAFDEAGNSALYAPLSLTVPAMSFATATSNSNIGNSLWHASLLSFGGNLFAIGGVDGQLVSGINAVYRSTNNGQSFTNVNATGDAKTRYSAGSIVFKNKMYIIGGVDTSTLDPVDDVISSSDGVTWATVIATPGFAARSEFQAVECFGKVWVIGGHGESGGVATSYRDVYYSDDPESFFSSATSNPGFGHRGEHAVICYKDRLYVMGGIKNPTPYTYYNDVWASYDGTTWNKVSDTMPETNMYGIKGFVLNDHMCITGGSSQSNYVRKVWCSRDGISWDNWSGELGFAGREYFGSTIHNSSFFLMGGAMSGYYNDVRFGE